MLYHCWNSYTGFLFVNGSRLQKGMGKGREGKLSERGGKKGRWGKEKPP